LPGALVDALPDFQAMDADVAGRLDPEADTVAAHFQDRHDNLVFGQDDFFATLPCQDQHGTTSK